jgi:MYXO-CTERM domain-containing protein
LARVTEMSTMWRIERYDALWSRMIDRFARPRFLLANRRFAVAIALGVGLWAGPAAAHVELLVPTARYSPDFQKSPPCGHPDNPPGAGPVATYQAGETITIVFDEFINHPGHYRVALDPTGTDAFVSPTGFQDYYNSPEVLLDAIPDMNGGMYSVEVTLPDTPCDPCTLQLIQVMNDGAWGPGNSDLYFQCADIVIEGAGGGTGDGTGGDDTDGDGTGGGGSASGPGGTSPGGDVGSGGPVDSDGGTTVASGTEGTAGETDRGSSGSGDAEDGGGGCSCRTAGSSPAAVAPWLLVGLLAVRRRRR